MCNHCPNILVNLLKQISFQIDITCEFDQENPRQETTLHMRMCVSKESNFQATNGITSLLKPSEAFIEVDIEVKQNTFNSGITDVFIKNDALNGVRPDSCLNSSNQLCHFKYSSRHIREIADAAGF